jgi:glycosyltransferase involved in cell wall biosynthesis
VRAAFVAPGYSVGKSLTIHNTALLMVEAGYTVDVFGDVPLHTCPRLAGVTFHSTRPVETPPGTWQPSALGRVSHDLEAGLGAVPGVRAGVAQARRLRWVPRLAAFTRWLAGHHRRRPFDVFVGCEPEGLIAASAVAAPAGLPVVYFSLELHVKGDGTPPGLGELPPGMHALERRCHRRAAFTLVQDAGRAALLVRHNRVPEQTIVPMPVAGLGPPERRRSKALHERLGIPPERRVVLHAGGIFPWSRCHALVRAAPRLPDGWVAVLHGYPSEPSYVDALRREAGERVVLSLEPLPRERMLDLIASADIGLVLYQDLGPNLRLTRFASNRLVDFLVRGIPVLVPPFEGFQALLADYPCGVAVRTPEEIADGVAAIAADPERYERAALDAYRSAYDARLYAPAFIEALDEALDRAVHGRR